ncbi:UDP-glycosyltransferase 90A1-like [Papaver somniferum]|uniref:UDP-glycosyltransferase 90A1-like n=1 Tax=Papaver somniferum TaxID=3469 RepID=UPI000E6F66D4|nr:UDP-glycosyltransferase 90A1-like [Papaver somniferum]
MLEAILALMLKLIQQKGHTIPLVNLARPLCLHRNNNITVTIFTTKPNSAFIRQSLSDTKASVVDLTFPEITHPEIPQGVESADKLPSFSLFFSFASLTKLLQPEFDKILESLQPDVGCIISDVFFPWSLESASKLNIPRYEFSGCSNFTVAIYDILAIQEFPVDSDDELFSLAPNFPNVRLTKNDLEPEIHSQPGEVADLFTDIYSETSNGDGIIANSFYALESQFEDYLNRETSPPKVWSVGPLCLAAAAKDAYSENKEKPAWIQWLDEMLYVKKSVLYVAFGSLAEITIDQFRELATGLENSGEHFLWVMRYPFEDEFMNEFEERVKGRGVLVKNQWVDQVEILRHDSVSGFMSHCGWNSVLESICESVPLLGFPITADQYWNARMVEDYYGVGVKVVTDTGSVGGFFSSECIANKVKELMNVEGQKGKEIRENVKKLGEKARSAMEEGGSSWDALDMFIDQLICGKKKK